MPTYDYVCSACGHELEIFHSMSEPPRRKCPDCGRMTLDRRIGAGAGILFKGSGFHETDYRSESYKRAARSEKQEKSETSEKSERKDAQPRSTAPKDSKGSRPKDSGKSG